MKKLVFLCGLVFSLLLISCNKKQEVVSNGGNASVSKSSGKSYSTAPSYFIYTGWILYEEDPADNCMVSKEEASFGDFVSIFVSGKDVDQKTAIRKLKDGTKDNFNFVRCLYNGEEYWTRDIFIAPINSGIAVMANDDNFFSQPNSLYMMTDKASKRKTLDIIITTGTVEDYYSCVIYDGNPYGKEIFVPKASVLTSDMAVEFSQIVSKINANANSKDTKYTKDTLDQVFTVMLEDWKILNKDATIANIVIDTVSNSSFNISENILNQFIGNSSDDYDNDYEEDYDYEDYDYSDFEDSDGSDDYYIGEDEESDDYYEGEY